MYYTALAILLILHLLTINLAAAGPLVSLLLFCWSPGLAQTSPFRGAATRLAKVLANHTLVAFFIGAALGAALLWLLHAHQDPFYDAVARFPAMKLWFAAGELAFYVFCQAAYCWLLRRDAVSDRTEPAQSAPRKTSLRSVLLWVLPLLAATNLLYHFPALLVAMVTLAEQPGLAPTVVDAPAFRSLLVEPQIATRTLHHVLAAVALAGVYGALIARRVHSTIQLSADNAATEHGEGFRRAAVRCGRLALAATLLQIPMGIVVLLNYNKSELLMGRESIGSALFVASMLLVIWLLAKLGALAFGDVSRSTVLGSAALLIATVSFMVGAMVRTRAVDANPLRANASGQAADASLLATPSTSNRSFH